MIRVVELVFTDAGFVAAVWGWLRVRKHSLALFLCAAFISVAMVSCGGDPPYVYETEQEAEVNDSVEVAETPLPEELPGFGTAGEAQYFGSAMTEFVPGDHGAVLPFVGGRFAFEWGGSVYTHGFINGAGEIISGQIFDEVQKVAYGDSHAFVVRYFQPGDGVYWGGNSIRGVISADGSFFRWFEDVHIPIQLEPSLIPVRAGGLWGAIDFYGNLVVPFEHPNAPIFIDGLAAVFAPADHEFLHLYFEYGEPFYYINKANELVLGPFELHDFRFWAEWRTHLEMMAFRDGLAMNFDGGRKGFIDRTGNVVIPHEFRHVSHFQGEWNSEGYTLVALYDVEELFGEWGFAGLIVEYALVDRLGNIAVVMPPALDIGISMAHGTYLVFGEDWEPVAAFDFRGNPMEIMSNWPAGNGYFVSFEPSSSERFDSHRISGNGIDRLFYGTMATWLFDDWFVLTDGSVSWLWNAQTDEVMWEIQGDLAVSNLSGDSGMMTGWLFREGESFQGLLNSDGSIALDFEFEHLRVMGDYFLAVQEPYSGLIGVDGEWLVRVPLQIKTHTPRSPHRQP